MATLRLHVGNDLNGEIGPAGSAANADTHPYKDSLQTFHLFSLGLTDARLRRWCVINGTADVLRIR